MTQRPTMEAMDIFRALNSAIFRDNGHPWAEQWKDGLVKLVKMARRMKYARKRYSPAYLWDNCSPVERRIIARMAGLGSFMYDEYGYLYSKRQAKGAVKDIERLYRNANPPALSVNYTGRRKRDYTLRSDLTV